VLVKQCCQRERRQHRAGRYCGGRMTRDFAGPRFFVDFFFAAFLPVFLFFIAMSRLR
jgi:hypothetical protein